MQPSPAKRRSQVIKDHGMSATFGLGSFPRVVDDEGIEVRDRTERQGRATARAESDGLTWQPLGTSMLAHMDHQLTALCMAQPEVLGQIAMGGRKIW